MSTSLLWTIPKSHVGARLKLVLPMLAGLILSAFFVKDLLEAVGMSVVYGGLLVGLTIYALVARDRRYELREDGFTEQVGDRPPRFRPWTEFAGYQTQVEASARRVRDIAADASAELGETFILRPRSYWGWGGSLPTTPATTPHVLAALRKNLPHRPGVHVNGPVILIVAGVLLAVFAIAVVGIALENS